MAPFRYSALLWAMLLGYLVFGDVPDAMMVTGASIIVASGLYAFYRERIRHRALAAESSGLPPDGLRWFAGEKQFRVPDAVQRATLLRRAGTQRSIRCKQWAPAQQRTAPRCAASGARESRQTGLPA